ncbi:hypothetical protein A4R44_05779 [Amycolatopsis sp. M39]|nr:hypothetical protein A4R44_05779 [Amycolatopsis sp. M39]
MTAPIAGARTPDQLEDNLAALSVEFAEPHLARLTGASAIQLGIPRDMPASDHIRTVAPGDLVIEDRR